jgi:hypothetical protein
MYRLFIDEVGNHDLKSSADTNHRYLGLCCVIMRLGYAEGDFTAALNALKVATLGTDGLVLHRRDLLSASPPFEALHDRDRRARFDSGLLELIAGANYHVITVVIDKQEHLNKYKTWHHHAYHYCLQVAIERYVLQLNSWNAVGDVLVESRGEKENRQLQRAYTFLFNNGARDYTNDKKTTIPRERIQSRLTSKELKIQPKTANIAGLQLADIIANPSVRSMICEKTKTKMDENFGSRIVAILEKAKYRRSWFGKVGGYGKKWLP